jgi:uncharacterized membrane protein
MDKNKYDSSFTHKFFRVSIFLKGLYSLLELIAGIALLLVNSSTISNFISNLFDHELSGIHTEAIINYITSFFSTFPPSLKLFFALYFIIHGAVKVGLIIALWFKKLRTYPIAIGVFGLFVVYQIYRYFTKPSWALVFLTVLDLVVILMTWVEWRHLKKM